MSAMRRPALVSFGFTGFIPVISTFFMAILMMLPLGTGAANIAMPHLVLATAFYWLSSRAILMPYGACAIIGLFLDLWLDVPLGMNMILLLLTRLFVLNQLKHYKGRTRLVHWVVFSVLAFALYLLSWLISSMVHGTLLPVEPILLQWMITSFSYAPVGFVMGRLRRATM